MSSLEDAKTYLIFELVFEYITFHILLKPVITKIKPINMQLYLWCETFIPMK